MRGWFLVAFFIAFCGSSFCKDRRPSYPFITGDGFRAIADYVYDEEDRNLNPDRVHSKSVIFVNTDYLDEFIKNIHPKIMYNYILITHNSDVDITWKYKEYLEQEKLIVWFAQNVLDIEHPKLFPIPIGLTNRYNDSQVPSKIEKFIKINKKIETSKNRRFLLSLNTALWTHKERELVYEIFSKKEFCKTISTRSSYEEFLKLVLNSKFVLSPRGNGLDCHRTWEALYLGAIPIVRKSALDVLFKDLPVLIINDWEILTEEFLLEKYKKIKNRDSIKDSLFMDYWIGVINSFR